MNKIQHDLFFNDADYVISCLSKKAYDTEWQAKFSADEQIEKSKIFLKWYRCKYCNKWHLTSN